MHSFFYMFLISFGLMFLTSDINKTIYSNTNFTLNSSVSTLYCGDSHAQYGLDDTSNEILNISYRSEKFIWTYLKLRKILSVNKHIENIYLSLSYHSFLKTSDSEIYGENKDFFYDRYIPLASTEDYLHILSKKAYNVTLGLNYLKYNFGFPFQIYKEFRFYLKNYLGVFDSRMLPLWGGFQKDHSNLLSTNSLQATYKRHFSNLEESSSQIEYFDKIVDLLRKQKINLILVTTPLHSSYRNLVPLSAKTLFSKHMSSALLKGARHIDLSAEEIPESFFKDHDHLNSLGANFIFENKKLGV